jgi:hypothetical protein
MTDARSGRANPGAHGDGPQPTSQPARHPVAAYFRANPQVFVLLLVCLVLGLGTFLAVLFGLVTAGSDQTTGEPSGAILGAHAMLTAASSLSL